MAEKLSSTPTQAEPLHPSRVDEDLWARILATTRATSFHAYSKHLESRGVDLADGGTTAYAELKRATHDFLSSQYQADFPTLVELIWSYWHEEAMLAQTVEALSQRLQSHAAAAGRDPLQNLEVNPLRPLSNLLWGYIQDEPHRISVARRAHEYEHHYGISLQGKAVRGLRAVDRRSKFVDALHGLLARCLRLYRQDDDKTVCADGFPLLNAIRGMHAVIAHTVHNQLGDLPATDRAEKLIEMWLLARPEMREFLGGGPKVPYPEAWMDRVDGMKAVQGWSEVSVVHFHDLGVFGEQLLLSIRFGSWSDQTDPHAAAAWARFWRREVQGYVHAYRATTGVDLSAESHRPVADGG